MDKEYIEREALIQSIEDSPNLPVSRLIKNAPAADVEPVVHGEWIPIVSYFHGKPTGKYYCSVCHRVEDVKGIYCRLCGALMDGGNK